MSFLNYFCKALALNWLLNRGRKSQSVSYPGLSPSGGLSQENYDKLTKQYDTLSSRYDEISDECDELEARMDSIGPDDAEYDELLDRYDELSDEMDAIDDLRYEIDEFIIDNL